MVKDYIPEAGAGTNEADHWMTGGREALQLNVGLHHIHKV